VSTLYLAARFERQDEMRVYRDRLELAGHVVTSRWLDEPGPAVPEYPAEAAQMCLEDIARSRWFVIFTDREMGRGGKDFETAWALTQCLGVRIVGPRVHVFHFLPAIVQYDTVDEFLETMGA